MTVDILVLNKTYEFLQITDVRRAIRLLVKGKAEIVEVIEGRHLQTITTAIPYPSVIRLLEMVRFPNRPVHYTRRRLFIRDKYTCAYCGDNKSRMTIDHVIPQSKGGKSGWDNCVTACIPCNKRKGNKMVEECGMSPRRIPKEPSFYEFHRACLMLANAKTSKRFSEYLYG